MAKRAVVFGGQGSQYTQMGIRLLENYKSSARLFEFLTEEEKNIVKNGNLEELSRTKSLQPIMLFYQLSIFEILNKKIDFDGVLGLSLGEYSALVAAEILIDEQAIQLVRKRAEAMDKASKKIASKMIAVLKTDIERLQQIIDESFKDHIYISNFNSSSQIVVSGEEEYIDKALVILKEKNIRAIPLKVNGAFHTPFMNIAAKEFEQDLKKAEFNEPIKDYYPNLTGDLYQGDDMVDILKRQITSPVLLYKSLTSMVNSGYDNFIEVGPGKVISTIIKRDFKEVKVKNIDEFSLEEI